MTTNWTPSWAPSVDPTTNLPLTSDQILRQIQHGEFANIEQYQAVYGRTSGAADWARW